jgi:hypothetical protein
MSDTVKISVNTEEEGYPLLSIREADETRDRRTFAIPAALFEALTHAREMVDIAEAAIMDHIGAANPKAGDVAEWLRDRRNEPRMTAAREAFAADHPDGPDWSATSGAKRLAYLDAAGYER